MSTNSNNNGRAYEYAWMTALFNALNKARKTCIVENSSLDANRRAWASIDEDLQEMFTVSAEAAVSSILELEPKMTEDDGDVLFLEFQKDDAGVQGDVRDIVIKRSFVEWQVGLSIKHNHEAVKHSRLSEGIDFGKVWFDLPCSNAYWADIRPIFAMLKREKDDGKKWSELADKEGDVYIPLLKAFMEEVKRANAQSSLVPRKMVEYLIGNQDYYKVVSRDSKKLTLIHTFNMNGTLNKPSKIKVSAITVPLVELPTEMVALKFKAGCNNTVEMYLNNGWQLSFRIHNASTKVETSLKFDVQFVGTPTSILNIECKWN